MSTFDCEEYDSMILDPGIRKLYANSAYYNMGFWRDDTNSIMNACENLVFQHIDLVDEDFVAKKILDAGCGLGASTTLLAEHFHNSQVVGVNISSKQISFLKQIPENVLLKQMDASRLSFRRKSFDLIISVEAVFHFDSRMDFIKRAFDVLKPGGILVFSDIITANTECMKYCSIPRSNAISELSLYNQKITEVGFEILTQKNVTQNSWIRFIQFLKNLDIPHISKLSDRMITWPVDYVLTKLLKS